MINLINKVITFLENLELYKVVDKVVEFKNTSNIKKVILCDGDSLTFVPWILSHFEEDIRSDDTITEWITVCSVPKDIRKNRHIKSTELVGLRVGKEASDKHICLIASMYITKYNIKDITFISTDNDFTDLGHMIHLLFSDDIKVTIYKPYDSKHSMDTKYKDDKNIIIKYVGKEKEKKIERVRAVRRRIRHKK